MEKSNQIETKTFKLSSTGIQLHLPLWNRCVPVILVINFLISSDIGYEIRDDFLQRITPIRQIWEIWQKDQAVMNTQEQAVLRNTGNANLPGRCYSLNR